MPISPPFFGYLLAFAAGISFVFQAAANNNLRAEIVSPWWAGFVSYLGGTLVMLVVAIALREPLPSAQMVAKSQWVSWMGGVFGAIYIGISILMLPRLGAATLIALLVAGQMIGSLAFDQFGLLGVPVHPISALRLAGAALLVGGVVLIRM
jgi:transporter family-2 protein